MQDAETIVITVLNDCKRYLGSFYHGFSTWGGEPGYLTLWAENILMTIPLGIFLYILWMPFQKAGWSLLAGGLFSLMIESVQLFTRLGKFETDDIMNNVFGTLIGFLVCKAGECKGEKTQEHLL